MKKLALVSLALLSSMSAFAYIGYYEYPIDEDNGMTGFTIFTLIVMIVYIILSIVILVRWWKMTNDVKEIREQLAPSHSNPKLTYLVAIGEKEQADKAALIMLVDKLMPIYYDPYEHNKAEVMNKYLASVLPKMEKLGIKLPEHVICGENFIVYINNITGNKVAFRA